MFRSSRQHPSSTAPGVLLVLALLSPAPACYSGDWKDSLADAGGDGDGDGDCSNEDYRCVDSGVERCAQGTWVEDRSNVGCEFAAASLQQDQTADGPAVALTAANPTARATTVRLFSGTTELGSVTVAADGAATLTVPWTASLAAATASGVAAASAFRVTSDEPVSLVQVNRADPQAQSSDASTLLPSHVWGDDYQALGWPHFVSQTSSDEGAAFWTALAISPVNLTASGSATSVAVGGGPFSTQGSGTTSLSGGDAAFVLTQSAGTGSGSCGWNPAMSFYGCGRPEVVEPTLLYPRLCASTPVAGSPCSGQESFVGCCGGPLENTAYYCSAVAGGMWIEEGCPASQDASDLSGSVVEGDSPFAFFSGHGCTNAPAYSPFCDHLEEQLWPVSVVGESYTVVAPGLDATARGHLVRIHAVQGPVTLTYTPSPPGAPTSLAAGEVADIPLSSMDFQIEASGPIQVVQVSASDESFGDPSMLLTPALGQGTTSAVFSVPAGYSTAALVVAGPIGTMVQIGGNSVELSVALTPEIGVQRVSFAPGPGGYTRLTASNPVVATVFARAPSNNSTIWFHAAVRELGAN